MGVSRRRPGFSVLHPRLRDPASVSHPDCNVRGRARGIESIWPEAYESEHSRLWFHTPGSKEWRSVYSGIFQLVQAVDNRRSSFVWVADRKYKPTEEPVPKAGVSLLSFECEETCMLPLASRDKGIHRGDRSRIPRKLRS